MSVQASGVIDLAGSPSPVRPMMSPSRGALTSLRKKRRSPRFNNDTANDNANANDNNSKKAEPEIIDLLADSPPETTMVSQRTRAATTGKKRRRPGRMAAAAVAMSVRMDDDDDDIVEIISPPKPAVAAAASSSAAFASSSNNKQQSPMAGQDFVSRIREVFPLLSRAKVETFLAMARKYAEDDLDDESVFVTVMTVLSDDPIGANITEATFAGIAKVGGRNAGAKPSGDGRQKVAQLECQCCFVEYDFEVLVSCRTGEHLFCKICLQKHTEQRVFGVGNFGVKPSSAAGGGASTKQSSKALEILCMASECTSGFREEVLQRALPEKVMKKYNELQFKAVVESANMGDVAKCTKCDFMAVSDPSWPENLFHCPQCNFKSCKACGEEYHPNIRCDQVETQKETDGRKGVEEAMTSALLRTCPRPFCRKTFLKSEGCNKMTCPCGAFVCYVCRKEIPADVAYKHFCQTPHCNHKSCNKCPLYADTAAADKKRVTEAAKKAAKSAKKMDVNIDVNSMLKDPSGTPGRKKR